MWNQPDEDSAGGAKYGVHTAAMRHWCRKRAIFKNNMLADPAVVAQSPNIKRTDGTASPERIEVAAIRFRILRAIEGKPGTFTAFRHRHRHAAAEQRGALQMTTRK